MFILFQLFAFIGKCGQLALIILYFVLYFNLFNELYIILLITSYMMRNGWNHTKCVSVIPRTRSWPSLWVTYESSGQKLPGRKTFLCFHHFYLANFLQNDSYFTHQIITGWASEARYLLFLRNNVKTFSLWMCEWEWPM